MDKIGQGKRLGEKSKWILRRLFEIGECAIDELLTLPPDHQSRGAYRVYYNQVHKLNHSDYINKIQKQDENKDNKTFFKLNSKGRQVILRLLHLENLNSYEWDGKWRVIIFDIPEDKKKWRDYLRRELKELGFELLQQSVYITPYEVTEELHDLLVEWGLRKYFRYLTVEEIDKEQDLKKEFDLD